MSQKTNPEDFKHWSQLFSQQQMKQVAQKAFVERKKQGGALSLLLLKLTNFDYFNDQFGQEQTDQLIQKISRLLTRMSRNTDCVGRFGPQAFLFVCKDTDLKAAELFGQRIQRELAQLSTENHFKLTADFEVSELIVQNDLDALLEKTIL